MSALNIFGKLFGVSLINNTDQTTTGARTDHSLAGFAVIAVGQSSVTVTNKYVSDNSVVLAHIDAASTNQLISCIDVGTGSFTVTLNGTAAGADKKVMWYVVN